MATLTIDNKQVEIAGERNLLELIRKADIDLPTFCYHSDLSVYGACRLCLVQVEGRGIQAACSTPPEAGLTVRTTTEQIREIRRISVELLLANHDQSCPTCAKSASCQLQDLARRLGVTKVRFRSVHQRKPVDDTSDALVRDPNKCVLCGDCVRFCSEVQGVGAIDFAFRGHQVAVLPSMGKGFGEVECVNCGQCATVCPTGALAPKSEVDAVWKALGDPTKTVIAQIAPAVRVAIGECFGSDNVPGNTGRAVAALKRMGFKAVYDTAFTADLTVIEEAEEFIARKTKGERLPQFTSCCPGWVKFAEQYLPDLLPNLSSCRSPQQMLGSLAKEVLPAKLGIRREDLVVVSIMPCTAKKFEARRPEFARDGVRDVDNVLTTQELARMIEEAGLRFQKIEPESFDMPMGFKTGAGVIFGNSGGVSEAVLRYAAEKLTGRPLPAVDFPAVRGEGGVRMVNIEVAGIPLRLAIVHGLANALDLAKRIERGEVEVDLVEVMACPGGCIGGAGQPVSRQPLEARRGRTKALYEVDKHLDLHKSQENHFVKECYDTTLGAPGSHVAHRLLHTDYQARRRITGDGIDLNASAAAATKERTKVRVCVGTSCFVRHSQSLLQGLLQHVEDALLQDEVDIGASFCFEQCATGPTVTVGRSTMHRPTLAEAIAAVDAAVRDGANDNGNGARKE